MPSPFNFKWRLGEEEEEEKQEEEQFGAVVQLC